MKRSSKLAWVVAGYAGAFGIACGVTALWMALNSERDTAASSGMYAFGETLLFVGVFGCLALVPTALGLFFLRSRKGVWATLAGLAVVLASTGLVAVYVHVAEAENPARVASWGWWPVLALLRILAAPLFGCGFLLSAALAPTRLTRWLLLAATVAEGIACAYVGIHWLNPNRP